MSASESAQTLAFVLLVVFLAYVTAILVPFLRRRPSADGDPTTLDWHVFVACRDEVVVIGDTLTRLRRDFPTAHVWVVDDASTDGTGDVVRQRTDPMVHLVERRLPDARTGKGAALNAAYAALAAWLPAEHDHDRVVVVVVDADGRLATNALAQAAGPTAFGDPRVGAAQAAVWMSNRTPLDGSSAAGVTTSRWGRWLVRMQDIEFRTAIAAMQCLRGHTLSVGLGGNGQFTRLSTLDRIGAANGTPWHGSLLEDYELGVHVMLAGFRNVYLHDTHVEQEGLPSVRRLLTQRTRWCQGGMQCAKYLPRIFASRHVTHAGAIEASYFLVQPFTQLAGVVLWPTVLVTMLAAGTVSAGSAAAWAAENWWLLPLVVVTGIAPFAMWPLIYRRRAEPGTRVLTALLWALGYWLYMYQSYVCVPRAFVRLVRGRAGWAKTRRNAESGPLLLATEV
ncbi:glycosyltransferase family 2 protein [Curtobacterium sp. VKM Ac-2922]|uniref:glycosyltransferase family 2 protein n=1 Tax=Curtobacterium sp. VKM Ac-2922 TaxID=2929475 RepID=UPI001FB50545|nr:glycosyltransferase family 2 protein [Curtobacterium sp. VKM Ac-2922]MCJ1713476.1 glycosyltransferase [Curtobacterium sp. VKM Ac-2922]